MVWPICAIGQPKVGTLDRTASSVALGFAVVKVSKGAFSHKGRQIRRTFHCHSGLVYLYDQSHLNFPKVSCNMKNKDNLQNNHVTSNLGPGQSFHRQGF